MANLHLVKSGDPTVYEPDVTVFIHQAVTKMMKTRLMVESLDRTLTPEELEAVNDLSKAWFYLLYAVTETCMPKPLSVSPLTDN